MNRLEQIQAVLEENNQPKFRLEQIKTAIFSDSISRYSQISNLSKSLKEQIISVLGDEILTLTKVHEAKGEQAHKVLFATRDNHQIESVRLQYKTHTALCISTQSGCALGCLFCATGAIGFKKNLSADEILDQVLYFKKNDLPIDSVIFMGMGEPLANPDNTFAAIDLMTDKDLLGISPRHLSISTVGIIPGIEKLTRDYPNINLAFSLHNPFNDERFKLMPITRTYPIEKVLVAIDNHLKITNRKVFIAYILLAGVNASARHALALANLVNATPDRKRLLHVNLIRYNAGASLTHYQKPSNSVVERFQSILTKNKVHHTLRQDFGTDIQAACGQLAATYKKTT
ncbi:MAG: radical SAM protein [Patescibacteria group bacterium]